jgi:hypothetical protein
MNQNQIDKEETFQALPFTSLPVPKTPLLLSQTFVGLLFYRAEMSVS